MSASKPTKPASGASKRAAIDQWADESGTELLLADGLDDAIIGVILQNDGRPAVLYDMEGAIRALRRNNPQWSREDATEWFDFNVARCLGDGYPAYLIYRPALTQPTEPLEAPPPCPTH